jgi:hypothetical protein
MRARSHQDRGSCALAVPVAGEKRGEEASCCCCGVASGRPHALSPRRTTRRTGQAPCLLRPPPTTTRHACLTRASLFPFTHTQGGRATSLWNQIIRSKVADPSFTRALQRTAGLLTLLLLQLLQYMGRVRFMGFRFLLELTEIANPGILYLNHYVEQEVGGKNRRN